MTSDAHKAPRSHGDGREAVGRSILPTPCTCTTCARPCVWTIRGDLHWVTCRQCRRGKHRSGAL